MNRFATFTVLAVLALGAACDINVGKEEEAGAEWEGAANASAGAGASAEGRLQQNTVSIKVPGVDIKVAVPESVRKHASFDKGDDMLYPGATFTGMHVEGKDQNNAGVEIGFTSPAAPPAIAAWYQEPARKDISAVSVRREGDALVVQGRQKKGDPFKVRLVPKAGGGTDGRLVIQGSR